MALFGAKFVLQVPLQRIIDWLLVQDDRGLASSAEVRAAFKQPDFVRGVLALMAHQHRLAAKQFLLARDFAKETLVTYPIPDERIDVIREVLGPADVHPPRRATELTVAILQLVASQRGIAAMPGWAVQPYLDRDYVASRPIRKSGLFSNLYAATTKAAASSSYMTEFLAIMKRVSFNTLKGVAEIG